MLLNKHERSPFPSLIQQACPHPSLDWGFLLGEFGHKKQTPIVTKILQLESVSQKRWI